MTEQTSPLVAANATRQDVLDLRGLTVIGVMRAHDGPAALLRSGRGRIARVQVGARAFGVTITAIADDRVVLTARSGASQTVAVAGS
ncbi:MAG: hypothetical protein AAF801_08170 [Pseudomonadota bacterium]